jgi:hypothetical protein
MTSKDDKKILNFKICGGKQYLYDLKSPSEFLCRENHENIKSPGSRPRVERDNSQIKTRVVQTYVVVEGLGSRKR